MSAHSSLRSLLQLTHLPQTDVYYLTTYVARESTATPKEVLAPATEALLQLARGSEAEWQPDGSVRRPNSSSPSDTSASQNSEVLPLLRLYHRQRSSTSSALSAPGGTHLLVVPFPPPAPSTSATGGSLVSSLDDAALQAEELFWAIEGPTAREAAEQRAEARRKRRDPAEYVGRVGAVEAKEEEEEEGIEFFAREKEADENETDE